MLDDREHNMDTTFAKLGVGDQDFLVASMIERCPKVMMLRELLMNAIEAASRAEPGARRVEVSGVRVDGVRKLCIWNTGPGMDAEQLFRMCDIASSIGKAQGLDRNFGMGAKVASLPSNQLGVRYRSCRAGRVHQVLLGKRAGVYGRLAQIDASTGQPAVVVEVTTEAQADGRSIETDWTEVVLFGNRHDQDTVADPYDRNPSMLRNWLATAIYSKFYHLNESVEVLLSADVTPMGKPRRLVSLESRIAERFARHDTVLLPEGLSIHYLYDPAHPTLERHNASFEDGLVPDASIGAVLHGGELYELRREKHWTLEAPSFGVSFGARHISVLVELSSDFPVRPDGYRQFLRYQGGAQEQVRLNDFAGLVRANRPEWLRELIESMSPDLDLSRDISDHLRSLLAAIGVKRMRPKLRRIPVPALSSPVQLPRASAQPRTSEQRESPAGKENTPEQVGEMVPDVEFVPELLLVRQPNEIADRNLTHRAARYYPEAHQLFVNMSYPSVGRLAAMLQTTAPAHASGALASSVATSLAEQDHLLRIGRALVMGLGKRDLAEGWNEADKRMAVSSEVLTIAADDVFANRAELTRRFQAEVTKASTELAAESII
ncbi:ATP-binding protein [Muricoccus pecuniae]|uniref:Histidine kinase-, DNA gyrase B-, and HSP90-like ATPase n=1 Tax=Muricoccus pecuniae TaxID=693023 RepID=A0A840YGK5_9PROT|nr:ATP-binding protein [Roseomonas pecuniae]MBB5693053.1 hypothetical protein [Roseomonas pecuniae]